MNAITAYEWSADLQHYVQVSGRRYAQVALLPGEESLVPFEQEFGCATERVWMHISEFH
jgi:hypothetical protein